MKWHKMGLVFCPDNNHEWMVSHAANPIAEHIEHDLFRIYFGCRDKDNRTSIGYVEIDIRTPNKVLSVSDTPIIGPGKIGAFDDSGTSMGCLVNLGQKKYLYYLGWNLGVTCPWRNSIGLAVHTADDHRFAKFSEAPIMDRNKFDPYSLSYPWVVRDEGTWKMWYGSHLAWGTGHADMKHVIKYAESADGIRWKRDGLIAIHFATVEEYAISRPCVVRDGGLYKMWYSYRGAAYRIGYAESADGRQWVRLDELAGINVSSSGWDSESIEYASVFDHHGQRYMLYNGNQYGRTGFGLAVLATD